MNVNCLENLKIISYTDAIYGNSCLFFHTPRYELAYSLIYSLFNKEIVVEDKLHLNIG